MTMTADRSVPRVAALTQRSQPTRCRRGGWSPNTRKTCVTGWWDFISWWIENRCAGLPAVPADVDRYLAHPCYQWLWFPFAVDSTHSGFDMLRLEILGCVDIWLQWNYVKT